MGSFGVLPIFDNLVSRKWRVIQGNRVEFGSRGLVFSVNRVLLTVKGLRSFYGHSVHFRFRQPCISKTAGLRAKHTPKSLLSLCYQVLYGHCLPSCRVGFLLFLAAFCISGCNITSVEIFRRPSLFIYWSNSNYLTLLPK